MVNPFRYYLDDTMTKDSYTYTGWHEWVNDDNGNWRIKLKSSGVFVPLVDIEIDAFLVGGGGGGGQGGAKGGGGGYTQTSKAMNLKAGQEYAIAVAGRSAQGGLYNTGGNTTTAFGMTAKGGGAGINGGDGGSGGGKGDGIGGSDGSDGHNWGGKGQGTTTREFAEQGNPLYAGGGGGDGNARGGFGGGGHGSNGWNTAAEWGKPNTGGGGGCASAGGAYTSCGGSGIVVIRNSERFDTYKLINGNIIIETNLKNQSKVIVNPLLDSSITFKEDRAEIRYGKQGGRGLIATKAVDLDPFNKIRLYGKFIEDFDGSESARSILAGYFGVLKTEFMDAPDYFLPNAAFIVSKRIAGLDGYLELDISNIRGRYSVGGYGHCIWDAYKIEILK